MIDPKFRFLLIQRSLVRSPAPRKPYTFLTSVINDRHCGWPLEGRWMAQDDVKSMIYQMWQVRSRPPWNKQESTEHIEWIGWIGWT